MSGAAMPNAGEANAPAPLTRQVALQAAEWFVLLQSGEATAADRRACDAWRARAPAHESAWQRALQVSQRAASVPPALGSPTLRRPQRAPNRRDAARALALLMVAAPAGWLAWRTEPWARWTATHTTAMGERRTWTLADGSRIVLDTDSAVDVKFDSYQRLIHLRYGAIYIETAPDAATQHRPFIVATEHGTARAIGTRFTVRQQAQRSQVAVLQGAVEVTARDSAAVQRLQAGEQATFDRDAIGPVEAAALGAGQWVRGVLAVDDMRLDAFVAELSRYRPGLLRCDPAVAHLRITGAFQLADTDAILLNLAHLLPVQVHFRTRYWVTIAERGAGA